MQALLKIETVPISIEYVEKPKSHGPSQTAQLQVSHSPEQLNIRSNPIPFSMDHVEISPQLRQDGLTYTATAGFEENGDLRLNVQMPEGTFTPENYQRVGRSIDQMVGSLSGNSQAMPSQFQIRFDLQGLNQQLKNTGAETRQMDTRFDPPDLEVKVVQRPKVIIKYVGGPIYIPKSSDPNYEPLPDLTLVGDGTNTFEAKA